jgi:hypothetical protein
MIIEKFALFGGKIKLNFDLPQQSGPAFFRMLLNEFRKEADGLFHFITWPLGGFVG